MASPIHQFEIQELVPLEIGGVNLAFTNSSLWMLIGVVVSTLLLTFAMRRQALIPGRGQVFAELVYGFVHKMVRDNIGKDGMQYFPLIFTLFMFILMGNLLGLLPYSFTYTSHLIVTAILALFIFFIVIGFGIYNHGTHFFSLFLPPGVPWWLAPFMLVLEMISFFSRPLTLSVRLFANMMAGHIILKVIIGFAVAAVGMGGGWILMGIFPVLMDTIMLIFECLIAVIQAYVFAILACVYLKDTVELHH